MDKSRLDEKELKTLEMLHSAIDLVYDHVKTCGGLLGDNEFYQARRLIREELFMDLLLARQEAPADLEQKTVRVFVDVPRDWFEKLEYHGLHLHDELISEGFKEAAIKRLNGKIRRKMRFETLKELHAKMLISSDEVYRFCKKRGGFDDFLKFVTDAWPAVSLSEALSEMEPDERCRLEGLIQGLEAGGERGGRT